MLAELQRAFRAAVLGAEDGALTAQIHVAQGTRKHRIAVYRNTVQTSLIEVLAAAFPTVQRIVGADYFTVLASAFATAQPPRAPQLFAYGAAFPAFVAARADAHRLPYLADVAALEWARGEAYFAPDADVLDPSVLNAAGERVPNLRFDLHPAVRRIASPYPVVTIWNANRPENDDVPAIEMQCAETALVSRPGLHVITRLLAAGDVVFIKALAQGGTLGAAAEAALNTDESFNLQEALEGHLYGGTFARAR